jgi:hypothetical protein
VQALTNEAADMRHLRVTGHIGPVSRQKQFRVFAVCQPDALSRFAEGFAMTVRVRLIHAQVRRLLLESGRWRDDAWGAPINQCHMAGTNLMFSVGVLDGLSRLGYRFEPVEREALVHLWRYAGYLLGVDPELLTADEIEGNRLLRLMFEFEPEPDDSVLCRYSHENRIN